MSDQDTFVSGIEVIDTTNAYSTSASIFTNGGISIFNTSTAIDFNNGGSFLTLGGISIAKNTIIGGITTILNTTNSSNTTSGALIVSGGAGFVGNVYGNFSNFQNLQVTTTASIPNLINTTASIGSMLSSNFNSTNITTNNLFLINTSTIPNTFVTNSTITNTIITNSSITNLLVTNSSTTNLINTNSTITNSRITNSTISNIIASNINTTNITIGSFLATYGTTANLYTNGITTNNILVTGSTQNIVYIDCQNSTTNPGILIFKNSSGTGDLRIYGDGGDLQLIGGGSRAVQLGSYHEIRLKGGSTSTAQLVQINGSSALHNTIIENTNDSIALRLSANATQTNDLTQWTNNVGTVYTRIDRLGNLQITSTANSINSITGGSITTSGGVSIAKSVNIGSTTNSSNTSTGALIVSGGAGLNGYVYANDLFDNNILLNGNVFGTEYNYRELLVTAGTTSSNFTLRTSMTTSSLLGGMYKVNIGYTYYANSSTSSDSYFLGILDATAISTGNVFHEYVDRAARTTTSTPKYSSTTYTLSPGIHTVSLVYRSQNNGQTTNIAQCRLELYRAA